MASSAAGNAMGIPGAAFVGRVHGRGDRGTQRVSERGAAIARRDAIAESTATVSLVLGGGGARGLAHIGVIRWLGENGYRIRSIAGTSMGALVGGIYAAGKLQIYVDWVSALERIDVVRLLDPSFSRSGLFKGERIIGVLRELIGDCAIEDLPIAFTAVATDLESGAEVWLREGKLFDAIRASIATPMVFTPFAHRGRMLLDGSLVNPVPVTPTVEDTTDLTIAVSLSGRAEPRPSPSEREAAADDNSYRQRIRAFIESLHLAPPAEALALGPVDMIDGSMETMQNTIGRLTLEADPPDLVIEIPRNACAFHEFWRAQELIALGRERTARAFAAFGN